MVQDYALIKDISVRFTDGLNILSGETGAGKSILVGALGLLLGTKADTSMVRVGAKDARVSGIVYIGENMEAREWLVQHEIESDDGSVVLRRSVKANGRSTVFIQSSPVTLRDVAEFTSLLFDMHGQHEHQSLLNHDNHRMLLDRFGGSEQSAQDFHVLFEYYRELTQTQKRLVSTERERLRDADLLNYALQEIRNAHIRVDEEEELEKERLVLANYETMVTSLNEVYSNLSENRGGCLSSLRSALHSMEVVCELDAELAAMKNQMEESFYSIEDAVEQVRKYSDRISYDPNGLEAIDDRLSQIRKLKKKYGDSVEEVIQYAEQCEHKLQSLEHREEEIQQNNVELKRIGEQLVTHAAGLSKQRSESALSLEKKIERELQQLGMPKVGFRVLVEEQANALSDENAPLGYNAYGKDAVEFIISPNPGEPYRKLRTVASGGELSRIMLAIKSVLAESDHIGSLIFDEIDAGIGGEVALAVGERLKVLARKKQVLCITHLATIAVRADNHMKVEKREEEGRALAAVVPLEGQMKKAEIARMLSGDEKGPVSLVHAEELLDKFGAAEVGENGKD